MLLNLKLRKIAALVTTVVMIWNIAGWLGTGLVMNHAHHGSDSHTCEIAFCYCETDGDETICTCHHNDLNSKNEHKAKMNIKPAVITPAAFATLQTGTHHKQQRRNSRILPMLRGTIFLTAHPFIR